MSSSDESKHDTIPEECQLCRPNDYRGDGINSPEGSVTVRKPDGGVKFVYCCERCAIETFDGPQFNPLAGAAYVE